MVKTFFQTLGINPANEKSTEHRLKHSISEPYNFQHLTHTRAKQFDGIQRASDNELITEFSAIRASQAPRRELQGIKTEELHRRTVSSQVTRPGPSSVAVAGMKASPSKYPDPVYQGRNNVIQSPSRLYHYGSDQNLSLSSPRSLCSFSLPKTPPLASPRSVSPHSPLKRSFAHQESPTAPRIGPQQQHDYSRKMASTTDGDAFWIGVKDDVGHDEETSVPHAVTTPDDTAMTLRPAPFGNQGLSLEDVPEEEESYFGRKSAATYRPRSVSNELRHAKSFPAVTLASPIVMASHRASAPRLESLWEDGRADPTIAEVDQRLPDIPQRSSLSRDFSPAHKEDSRCWEDDIDYCYDHAAEADCEFDWDRVSMGDVNDVGAEANVGHHSHDQADPTVESLELDPGGTDTRGHYHAGIEQFLKALESQQMSPVSVPSKTPKDGGYRPPKKSIHKTDRTLQPSQVPHTYMIPMSQLETSKGFPAVSTLLAPHDIDINETPRDSYHAVLREELGYQQPFPSIDTQVPALTSEESSPWSDRSALSKCHSQDSMYPSTPSSVGWRQRQSLSVGSLPELVHSKVSREKLDLGQLTDRIGSLNVSQGLPEDIKRVSLRTSRSQTLIKEVSPPSGLQNVTTYTTPEADDNPSLLRSREDDSSTAYSDTTPPTQSLASFAKRMRSVSNSTTASSRSSKSRASYSLFPSLSKFSA